MERIKQAIPFIFVGIVVGLVLGTLAYRVVAHYGQEVENRLIQRNY